VYKLFVMETFNKTLNSHEYQSSETFLKLVLFFSRYIYCIFINKYYDNIEIFDF